MPRHLKIVPDSSSSPGGAAAGDRSAEPGDEAFVCRVLARARPGDEQITVERLERADGAPIIYLNAADVVAFIYIGQAAGDSPQAGGGTGAGPVVIDVHRRTDAAQRRLRFLLDNAPARLLALDPAQFRVAASTGSPPDHLELICLRCQGRVPAEPADLLHVLVEAATGHSCPIAPDPAQGNGGGGC